MTDFEFQDDGAESGEADFNTGDGEGDDGEPEGGNDRDDGAAEVEEAEEALPATWRSALYPADWTPDFTHSSGAFLHDFSYAGYHNSEASLPATPPGTVFEVEDYGADPTGVSDCTAAVQEAIDAAEAAGGGVVRFGDGSFRFDGLLDVRASHVVLDGAGSSRTRLWFTRGSDMSNRDHITVAGSIARGPDLPLTADGAPRSRLVYVENASTLSPGVEVAVGWTITDAFVAEHGMTGTWYSFNGQWRAFFRRTVVSVDTSATPHAVTLDVPLRYPAKLRDGASLRVESGYVHECGIQELAVSNVVGWSEAWANDRNHAILLQAVEDCWVRDVTSWESPNSSDGRGKHLASGGIMVSDSKRVTVADCVMENAQNRGGGGNGYLVEISRSSEVLIRDSIGRNGRHNFIQNWDFGTSGCVFLRTLSTGGRALTADWDPIGTLGYSEFHHSIAMANLIDKSVVTDGWQGVNRHSESSGAGHSATQDVFWNLKGPGGSLRSLQFGLGYVIGTEGLSVVTDPGVVAWGDPGDGTEPEDWVEGIEDGDRIEPVSLFEDQLVRRLSH